MNTIDRLNPDWTIMASKPPATDQQIDRLVRAFPNMPVEYVELIRTATQIELNGRDKKYLRIYGPDNCIEMNEAYQISRYLPGAMPIGDNGGGSAIVYMGGPNGIGIYSVSYGALHVQETIFIASTLRDVLQNGVGMELI